MTSTNSPGYSAAQIGLHWLIAALVLVQLLFGESMVEVVDAAEEGGQASATDVLLSGVHYWAGIAILALVALRLVLRLTSGVQSPRPSSLVEWAATAMHWAFYGLLFMVPISGLVALYINDEVGDIHSLAKPVFVVLIAAHAAAALYHQFIVKDGTLRRMLVPRS